jgi:hypothetical protein
MSRGRTAGATPALGAVIATIAVQLRLSQNQPMYKRFSVLVIQAEKRSHKETLSRLSKVAVIKIFIYYKSSQIG